TSFLYDGRGNLTSDGTRLFCYDLENHLTGEAASGGNACSTPSFSLAYDPLGRIHQTTASSVSTSFLYDGDRLVAEYDGGGLLQRRYVHGAGVDEPFAFYQRQSDGTYPRAWLHADNQGSIIATSDAGGVASAYSYGPYGEPNTWTGSRY